MDREGSRREISDEEWKVIVQHVPIVSVDLLVRHEGGIVLGKRENEPAKGRWFVPGGTVLKHERRTDAVQRVAREELGTDVEIERELGTYEHYYDTADVPDVDGKHYLATAYVVHPTEDVLESDAQHAELRTFTRPFPELHPYVERYLEDLERPGSVPDSPEDENYR